MTEYDFELVCQEIETGSKGLRRIVPEHGFSVRSFYDLEAANPELKQRYALARERQADWLADELLEICDSSELDPNDKRVRVDTRKWIAAKLRPKSYGDRLETTGEVVVKWYGKVNVEDI